MEHQILPLTNTPTPSTPLHATKKHSKKQSANTGHAPVTDSADDDDIGGPLNIQDSVKIQDIVKSASNRAKTARSRALNMSRNTSRLTKSAVA